MWSLYLVLTTVGMVPISLVNIPAWSWYWGFFFKIHTTLVLVLGFFFFNSYHPGLGMGYFFKNSYHLGLGIGYFFLNSYQPGLSIGYFSKKIIPAWSWYWVFFPKKIISAWSFYCVQVLFLPGTRQVETWYGNWYKIDTRLVLAHVPTTRPVLVQDWLAWGHTSLVLGSLVPVLIPGISL